MQFTTLFALAAAVASPAIAASCRPYNNPGMMEGNRCTAKESCPWGQRFGEIKGYNFGDWGKPCSVDFTCCTR
ncbi:hypothetical protein BDP55DRAFT_725527 [Colletotrichum godetiae]|uniref:Uncharacterized protein n=1 Tax=Colletotrichum godetiae TaxID=1209918 RepID=A0AAJ0AUZ9_9PEZI|nr:uncharacterized protein BDP55DRAFT_725527 [Colletotrichum godetiae]KAK1689345.1 hypothetical protein BDP55DRAFT_725527 [Colletotrichum godetiae]